MKKLALTLGLFFFSLLYISAQNKEVHIYNPDADAHADIKAAVAQAKEQHKNVILMIGGNWCPWCVKFHAYINDDPQIDSLIKADYIWVMVNYDKQHPNKELLAELGYPQRFGFPVFVVLNSDGKRIHTQDSGLLEDGPSYDKKKVMGFLKNWTPTALDPKSYLK